MDRLIPPSEIGSSLHGVLHEAVDDERAVVLTFDDGPRRGDTDAVLAELARVDASATFFVLLVRARADMPLLADILAAGHEIALYGADHRRLTRFDPKRLPTLLRDSRAELEDLTSQQVQFFRPAYGAQNAAVWQAVVDADLVSVVWQRECREWDATSAGAHLAQLDDLEPGTVVLAHDTTALPDDGAEPFDVPDIDRAAITRAVLARLASQQLVARSLDQGLRGGSPVWRIWLDTPVPAPSTEAAS